MTDEELKNLTSVLSTGASVTGALTALYGAVRLIPREFSKWREQKRAELRATTAAKALHAGLRFVEALHFVGNIDDVSRDALTPEGLRAFFSERAALIRPDIEAFSDARDLVSVFLDDEEERVITELWDRWFDMRSSADSFIRSLSSLQSSIDIDSLSEGSRAAYVGWFQQHSWLDYLRTRMVDVLRPIARLDKTL